MFEFFIYETVDFSMKVTPKEKIQNYDEIVVSLKQNEIEINKRTDELGIDVENAIINMHLTQEETALFKKGDAKLQVNIYYGDTERDVSYEVKIKVLNNIYKKIMPNE